MQKDSLGDRMKAYEIVPQSRLIKRMPTIIRIDGKAFHTFTKRFKDSFSLEMHDLMVHTSAYLVNNIQNCVLAYTQSDEISLLLTDWNTFETQQWFDGKIQKITSVAASLATGSFNAYYHNMLQNPDCGIEFLYETAFFDARVFNLPKEEVVNYFIWRQQDASRNSVQMLGRMYFSDKELHKKSNNDIQNMLLLQKDINWNDLDTWKKRGACATKAGVDNEIPVFTQMRNYVGKFIDEASCDG